MPKDKQTGAMRPGTVSTPFRWISDDWDTEYQDPVATHLTVENGGALFYAGEINLVCGRGGQGKTWLALQTALETAQRGETVLYIDFENGERLIRSRLKSLGLTKEQGTRVAHHQAIDKLSLGGDGAICAFVRDHNVTLVVIDSLARALASAKREENLNSDIAWFIGTLEHLRATGTCVLILDHVGHPQGTQGVQKPRGASAKIDQVSIAYYFKVIRSWSKKKSGKADLVNLKHRVGDCAEGEIVATMLVDVSHDDIAITMTRPNPDATDATDNPEIASQFLEILKGKGSIEGKDHASRLLSKEANVSVHVASRIIQNLIDAGLVEREQERNGKPVTLRIASAGAEALVA